MLKEAARAEARETMKVKMAEQLETVKRTGKKVTKRQRRAARLAANNQAKASFLAAGGSVKEYKREKARATRESAGDAMMDCVEGKIEELELNEGEKPSASEMRQAKTDCKEEAEEVFLDSGGRAREFNKARAMSSRTRAVDSLEDCIADAVPDPKTASRNDMKIARSGCEPVQILQSPVEIECSAFRSYGIDAHACGVLCDASTGPKRRRSSSSPVAIPRPSRRRCSKGRRSRPATR